MEEYTFRIALALIFVSGFGISGYFRRKADQQTGEKISRNVDGKTMSTIIKIGGLILWLSPIAYMVYPPAMAWAKIGLPEGFRWAGIALGFICVPLIYWLFSSIGSGISPTSATRQEHKLITKGPYRWVRHPLYTIGASNFVAFGLIADNWFIILLGIFTFIIMAIRTPKEEANLIEKFGEEYKAYMQKTGRFFPRIYTGN
ncbi:MAG: isoprenylcysteine carboxylmethyltransferase family protein [Bacteroidetes bacterium]|nr:isoprenylcysteine carboxylmethyltransferase family protein [Bacteroidota bacterium]MCB0851412.1 isoprenylcysteine carboxylmethyltransferase family protein [Bacteroidota bacterium]